MNAVMIGLCWALLSFNVAAATAAQGPVAAPEHRHGEGHDQHTEGAEESGHADTEGTREIHLNREQREVLSIRTVRLALQPLGDALAAPGEVRLNTYATAQVTPRIAAQVLARHARLGETVSKGQPLVTLSSVEVAQAQGEVLMAEREWQRVRSLGEKVVSARRFLEVRVARQQARARVQAFGMQPAQVKALLRDTAQADGSFQLLALRSGTVIRDDFILGEFVEPGRVLFEITDEHVRWVAAQMAPQDAARVAIGGPARIRYGETWLDGRVIQIHHALDQATRTQAVRIEVPDPGHKLHPGVFVDVRVRVGGGEPALTLPEAAVLRSPDGDWQVFVAGEEAGRFTPREVELVHTAGGMAVIRGLPVGTEVVTRGAFFLQSELAKSGFHVHQH